MKSPFSKLSVIKLPKTRRFEYTPRHYDEAKERLERRKKEIAQELGLNDGNEAVRREINFRAKMDQSISSISTRRKSMASNFRLIIILVILLVICYYIYLNLDTVMEEIAN